MFADSGQPPEIEPQDLIAEADVLASKMTRDDARFTALVGQVAETRAHLRDGYSSPTAMLKHRYSMHQGAAHQLVRRANGLAKVPLVTMAYEQGAITSAQVDVLLEASYIAPDSFSEQEGSLVELAMDTPLVRELRKHLDYWLQEVAPDEQASDQNLLREFRGVRIRRADGLIKASVGFDEEAGEQFIAALEPGPPAEEDNRTIYQRRADQLMDIISGGTKRPSITVHVSAGTLIEGAPGTTETSFGTYLSAFSSERLACDAYVSRVVFGPESHPLDVGRSKRLVTPAMRIALEARDLGCVFPGCDRPAHWCDAHHILHWSKGGQTCLENCVLLCRHHHTLFHEAGWSIRGKPGSLQFFRPDGSRPPPTRGPVFEAPRPEYVPGALGAAIRDFHGLPSP